MKRAVFTKTNAPLRAVFALVFASAFISGVAAQATEKPAPQTSAAKQNENQCAGKINRAKILEWLASDDVSQGQIINFVKQCGVDFALTESARGELTRGGARAGLLDAIAENYRPPTADKPPTAAPVPVPTPAKKTSPVTAPPSDENPKPVAAPSISAPLAGGREGAPPISKESASPAAKEIAPPPVSNGADKYSMPDYTGSPVNKTALIKVLKNATFSSKDVVKVIEEHGVSFPMTLGIEKELFQAASGLGRSPYSDDEWQTIIAKAWENYRSDKTDNPDLVKAIRLYQTSAGANIAEKIAVKSAALELFKGQEVKQPPAAQMLYFIAETYHELASLKYQNAFSKGYPTDRQTAEYAQLFDGAIAYHRKAVEMNAAYVDSWEKLAEIYGRLKKYNESIDAYKKLAVFAPKEVSYWIIIGDYYFKLGDYKSALDAKKRAKLLVKGRDLQLNKDIETLEKKVAGGQ